MVRNKWSALYEVVFKSNQVIAAYENLSGSFTTETAEERALEIYAEAKFFRGVANFYLHNSFNEGNVIIFDYVPVTIEDFYQPIRPANEVIDFARADLVFAAENLPSTCLSQRCYSQIVKKIVSFISWKLPLVIRKKK